MNNFLVVYADSAVLEPFMKKFPFDVECSNQLSKTHSTGSARYLSSKSLSCKLDHCEELRSLRFHKGQICETSVITINVIYKEKRVQYNQYVQSKESSVQYTFSSVHPSFLPPELCYLKQRKTILAACSRQSVLVPCSWFQSLTSDQQQIVQISIVQATRAEPSSPVAVSCSGRACRILSVQLLRCLDDELVRCSAVVSKLGANGPSHSSPIPSLNSGWQSQLGNGSCTL